MRGHIRKRSKKSWTIWVDLGRDATGKRRQKTLAVRGAKRDAERELAKMLDQIHKGTYVEPSTMLVREYLEKWLAHAATRVSPKTHERYGERSTHMWFPNSAHIRLGNCGRCTSNLSTPAC